MCYKKYWIYINLNKNICCLLYILVYILVYLFLIFKNVWYFFWYNEEMCMYFLVNIYNILYKFIVGSGYKGLILIRLFCKFSIILMNFCF